jgi:hypothetical protein
MLKVVIALVLAAHGIGHVLGILQVLRVGNVDPAWDGRSWIIGSIVSPGVSEAIGVVLWTVAMAGFLALAGVVMGWMPSEWWPTLAVVASAASIAGIVLFPDAFPTFSTIGALIVDIVVLVVVLWSHWSPSDLAA